VLLLKIQKKEVTKETMTAVQQISNFLRVLSEKYKIWSKEDDNEFER